MSEFVQLSGQDTSLSISNVLSPGIVGLFVQGVQTGLVITQLSQWLCLEQTERFVINALVTFVCAIGFLQTGICFASVWRIYVRDFGQVVSSKWTESVQLLLSTLVAAPIQAFFIWRCYYVLKKNIYLIAPLILGLISSMVMTAWVTTWLFHRSATRRNNHEDYHSSLAEIWYPFVACVTIPAVLDIVVTGILLYSLSTFLKRIHAEHLRRRISRFILVLWQAAIPPCLCAIALVIKYAVFTEMHPGKQQMWYPTIQAMLPSFMFCLYFTP
ncbi:hypothetical protein B0F90DRAFT_987679 [Multifurca ochricompacta]|uniref:Uncharacterized protein n=1 Tax=Multifurca ochricompacta TaxID=376703 RepID=A0AAD4QJ06_9AGAM|nr:hypothetical protein B0F90DRAFT_987679 [Multifurca ochricompacta]